MIKKLYDVNSDEIRTFGRVLLCNDDGIDAVGLRVLREIAHSLRYIVCLRYFSTGVFYAYT